MRANFRSGSRIVSGGYSALFPFTRRIATPTGLLTAKRGRHALLSWSPALMAKGYRVKISTSDSFSSVIESATTDDTNWAPKMLSPAFRSGQPLYWRVAVVDETTTSVGLRWPAAGREVAGREGAGTTPARQARSGEVTVTSRGKPISGALVSLYGPVLGAHPRPTGRHGTVRLRVRPSIEGTLQISVTKPGYMAAKKGLQIR